MVSIEKKKIDKNYDSHTTPFNKFAIDNPRVTQVFPLPLCFFFVDIPMICISSKLRLTRFRYNRERINRVIRGLIIYTEQNKIKINISFLFQSRPSYS